MSAVETAKRVLTENSAVMYGIFGVVSSSGLFPPREFLNQFLSLGYDPCDQDGRMRGWPSFHLLPREYLEIKAWWMLAHPGANENSLGAECWDDWVQEILNH